MPRRMAKTTYLVLIEDMMRIAAAEASRTHNYVHTGGFRCVYHRYAVFHSPPADLNVCTTGETEECVLKAKDQLLTVIADNNQQVDLHFGSAIKYLMGKGGATIRNVRTPTFIFILYSCHKIMTDF